jgi:hypothetical protein
MNHLPKVYQPVMKRAKSICIGVENEYLDDIKLLINPCADFSVKVSVFNILLTPP